MFSPINKQVTSKFQSAHKQQILSQINTMLSVAIPVSPVKSTRIDSLRRGAKIRSVTKAAAAPLARSAPPVSTPPAVSAPSRVSPRQTKKTSEKPNVEQKRQNANTFLATEKTDQTKTSIATGVPPMTAVSPRKIESHKIVAFGRSLTNPVMVPNFRRKNPISGGNDFRVTKSAYKPTMSTIFSYDLSPLERIDYGLCHKNPINPMKSVPPTEVQLLQSGQRSTYLEKRYERTPDAKYNYPEATSMRYGWFHRLGDPFQKRVPRKN